MYIDKLLSNSRKVFAVLECRVLFSNHLFVRMYHNLPTSVFVLQSAPWYSVHVLVSTVNALRKINFSIVEQRQQALERLNNMPCVDCPYAAAKRFDPHGLYVCEMLGDWTRKFQQLRSSLSYKDRSSEKSTKVDVSEDRHYQSMTDAHQAFWNATSAMYEQLLRFDGVYDVVNFEKFYSLDWH